MTYFELTSAEKDYYDRLSANEKPIYIANNEKLSIIDTVNDANVRSFVSVSRLLNELHRTHHRYNEVNDRAFSKQNVTADQKEHASNVIELNEESFNMTMAIGNFASTNYLACMDECDALYRYLATVKMSRFDWMCDNFDIVDLPTNTAINEFNDKWLKLADKGMINDNEINQWWCSYCGENRGNYQDEGCSEAGLSTANIKDNSMPIIVDCLACGREFGYYFNEKYDYSPHADEQLKLEL